MGSTRWARIVSLVSAALAAALVGALLPAPAMAFEWTPWWPASGSGQVVTQAYAPPHFDAVELRTRAAVELRRDDREAVSLRIDDNLAPLVDVYVRQRVLVIEDHRAYHASQAQVVVTAPVFTAITVAARTAVQGHDLVAPRLRVSAADDSAVALSQLAVETLAVDGSGHAALKLAGVANDLALTLGGDVTVEAAGLGARRVAVNASGRAAAVVAPERLLTVNASGAASVRYYGSPTLTVQADEHASIVKLPNARPADPQSNRR